MTSLMKIKFQHLHFLSSLLPPPHRTLVISFFGEWSSSRSLETFLQLPQRTVLEISVRDVRFDVSKNSAICENSGLVCQIKSIFS
ncbi:hypothetical protein J6590_082515 [Homalodisca vitripennis]|nr:hypothetical protein J6590_096843 [Homalodisca vitripennis]KAG8304918.1 hypothetical protein J6590_082515 [Homalodisca vitripennis]